jgi:hypothetical protein
VDHIYHTPLVQSLLAERRYWPDRGNHGVNPGARNGFFLFFSCHLILSFSLINIPAKSAGHRQLDRRPSLGESPL